jgi:hypothetical protein
METKSEPFEHWITIHGPKGENVRVKALWDGGAGVGAMDTKVWERNKHRMGAAHQSYKRLRMANGVIVPSDGAWTGSITVKGVRREGTFEIFDSGGGWEFLFGKPLQAAFGAIHDYRRDIVDIEVGGVTASLPNQRGLSRWKGFKPAKVAGVPDAFKGVLSFANTPARHVPSRNSRKLNIFDAKMVADQTDIKETSGMERERTEGAVEAGEERTPDVQPERQHKRTNSQGARATPVREVPSGVLEEPRQGTDKSVSDESERNEGEAGTQEKDERQPEGLHAHTNSPGACATPVREVPDAVTAEPHRGTDDLVPEQRMQSTRWAEEDREEEKTDGTPSTRTNSTGDGATPVRGVHNETIIVGNVTTDHETSLPFETELYDTDAYAPIANESIYTRATAPFNPARVAEVLKLVKLGPDLTDVQRAEVVALVSRYADIFALAVSEVCPVKDAVYAPNIPADYKFSTKVHQRPLTQPQAEYLHEQADIMEAAGIIRSIHPRDVKCVSPIKLAQKEHDGGGLTQDELKHILNEECVRVGLEPVYDLPPRDTKSVPVEPAAAPKWRICQNFHELNELLKVVPVPQGDIRDKQRRLSGQRYISVFDFASGFFAIPIEEAVQPYIVMFIPGKGYKAYMRMPFGLTDAPTEYGAMCASKLHDLLVAAVMELFVDDGGTAADTFEGMMDKLTIIFDRFREAKLSLSARKTKLFMTEAVFAGATVGPKGVAPDAAKLTAIVRWKQPQDALNLHAFLGLTSYFRDLVQAYAKVEKDLRDLVRLAEVPAGAKKQIFRTVMKNFKLAPVWEEKHSRCFINLKRIMLSDPVLQAPRFDTVREHPFIVTTDGSKDAFAGVLSQKMQSVLPGGKAVVRRHPIAFASKRTSPAEERYQPHLLEFAALKFSLDKFSDIIWGQPVKLETDCQALRDIMVNDKLNVTHTRWRDGVMGYKIVGAEHIKGTTNAVADALSRADEGRPKVAGDGSEWTVSPDWESRSGIINDLFVVEDVGETYLVMAVPEGTASLRERFKEEPVYLEVIDAILELDFGSSMQARKRARHRATQYFIEEGKLWRLGSGIPTRARGRRECITRAEARVQAADAHANGGHFHRDSVKLALMDRYHSPRLDESIVSAIADCARCKGFGPTNLHSLLDPVLRRHPFELVVGDYLSLPLGNGDFKTVGLYLDSFTQNVWGYMYTVAGSAETTEEALTDICDGYLPMNTFQSDQGRHFKNNRIQRFCDARGIKFHLVPHYSPWINGLVEGANRILIYILARLCAPDVGEDGWRSVTKDTLPGNWPDHFKEAIRIMNSRLLPSVKFSPKELLFGKVVNTPATPIAVAVTALTATDTAIHMAYVEQQRLDGYANRVAYAMGRKAAFDRKVLASRAGVVIFERGQLVQVYRSDLTHTMSNDRKLTVRWSEPHRIRTRILNAYELETVDTIAIDGTFSSRRLRPYIAREGTPLAIAQTVFMTKVRERAGPEGEKEAAAVAELRAAEIAEVERWRVEEIGRELEEGPEEWGN